MGEVGRRVMEAEGHRTARDKERRAENDAERVPNTGSEEGARRKIIAEARRAGSTLDKPDAKGGLPASLVLRVFRRDKYRCKRCGSRKDVGPHHKGGIVDSEWLNRKGHENVANNLTILCASCHDAVHEEARSEGVDSSQVLPEGDEGDPKRDKGDRPPARPPRMGRRRAA